MKSLGVVIPIYNTETYLRQCVESVLKQEVENLQIVLVDDGSTDGSGNICDEYASRYRSVKVVHQSNCGKIESRYVGASSLDTDYITFVDSDDWIADDAYSSLQKYLEEEIDIISFQAVRYVDENHQSKPENRIKEGIFRDGEYRDYICSTMIWDDKYNEFGIEPSLCFKIFKRDILLPQLKQARCISVSYGDDVAVVYPVLYEAKSCAVVNKYKYYYRKRTSIDLAPYFLDEDYFRKLTDLYQYLRGRFHDEPEYVRQLDMFFIYSSTLRLAKYGLHVGMTQYLPPFQSIPHGSKVILYGAGQVGRMYYCQINELEYCQIVAWVDRESKNNDKVIKLYSSLFQEYEYDYILIALKSKETAMQVRQTLETSYKVKTNKIIWQIHECSIHL